MATDGVDEWVGVDDEREVFNVIVVLDESGSMSSMGNEPEQCLNMFVQQMKDANLDKKRKVLFSLYRFGTSEPGAITASYKQIELKHIPEKHGFKPFGATPMYDCIGMALKDNEGVRSGVCHIITDGEENASTKYNRQQVFDMISHMETNLDWVFQFTGAGKDTYAAAQSIGIAPCNTIRYDVAGYAASMNTQGAYAVAIGNRAGQTCQGANSVVVGMASCGLSPNGHANAGQSQGFSGSVSQQSQGFNSVCIGSVAQGAYTVAVGTT